MTGKRGSLYLLRVGAGRKRKDDKVGGLWSTKIGHVRRGPSHSDVEKRIKELKTGNPIDFVKKASIPCAEPRKWERYFHKIFASKRVKNEWFDLNQTDVKHIGNTIMLYEQTGQGPDCDLFRKIMPRTAFQKTMEMIQTVVDKHMPSDIRIKHEKLAKKYGRSYLDEEEARVLRQALMGHPKAILEIGNGMQHFFVEKAKGLYRYCFHIGKTEDKSKKKK